MKTFGQCKFRLFSGNEKRDGQTDGKTDGKTNRRKDEQTKDEQTERRTDGHGLHLMPHFLRRWHNNLLIESVVIIIIKTKHLPLHVVVVVEVFFLSGFNLSKYFFIFYSGPYNTVFARFKNFQQFARKLLLRRLWCFCHVQWQSMKWPLYYFI